MRLGKLALLFVCTVPCALSACGDDDGSTPTDADAMPNDTSDGAATTSCETALMTDASFAIDPSGPVTQIHANATSDGSTVWVAYNRPAADGSGKFDVFLVGLACDGTQAIAPQQINTTTGRNDIDPAIALGDDGGIAVVWASDNGAGTDNIDLFVRTFDGDGTPRGETDRIVETTRGGEPVTGVAWMPAIAPQPGGTFAIAGSRAVEEAGTFQAFVQRVDGQGILDGDAFDGSFEAGVGQVTPTLAADDAGELWVAWTRSPVDDDDRVVHGRVASEATEVAPQPPPFAASASSDGAHYHVAAGGTAYLAVTLTTGEVDVLLLDATTAPAGGQSVRLGQSGRTDHTAALATAADDRGAAIWYRNVSGIRNDVIVQAFTYDGSTFALGAEQSIPLDVAAAPYPPTITHVVDDVYFIAWSDGVSPDFVINGRFIDLSGAQP